VAQRWDVRDNGDRFGPGPAARRSHPRIRAFLSGRQVTIAPGHRPRPGDREASGGTAWGNGGGGQPPRRRCDIYGDVAHESLNTKGTKKSEAHEKELLNLRSLRS